MKKLFSLIIAVLFVSTAFTQSNQYISYKFLNADYLGPIDNKYFDFSDKLARGVQIGYHRDLNSSWRLNVPLRVASVKYPINKNDATRFDRQSYVGLDATGAFKFNNGTILKEDAKLAPYLLAGIGVARLGDEVNKMKFNVPLGVGLTWEVGAGFYVQVQSEYRLSQFNHVHHTAGLVFDLGGNKKEEEKPIMTPIEPPTGISDRDGDGIADDKDSCPDIAGIPANNGCPAVEKEVEEILTFAKTGVKFETNSAVIKTSSYEILDKVVAILKAHPEYNLRISGHTDSQGQEDDNLTLSMNRAKSCMTYITSKGISPSRITHNGFGESKPVADNATPEGRAENRRVEFEIYFGGR